MEQRYEATDLEVHYHGQQAIDCQQSAKAKIDQERDMVDTACRRLYLIIGLLSGVVAMTIVVVTFMLIFAIHVHDDIVQLALEVSRANNK